MLIHPSNEQTSESRALNRIPWQFFLKALLLVSLFPVSCAHTRGKVVVVEKKWQKSGANFSAQLITCRGKVKNIGKQDAQNIEIYVVISNISDDFRREIGRDRSSWQIALQGDDLVFGTSRPLDYLPAGETKDFTFSRTFEFRAAGCVWKRINSGAFTSKVKWD